MPREHAYALKPGHPTPGLHNLLRPPIASCGGTGILTSFPSTTRFRLVLGADSPCADERCAGNLGLTARELFTPFIATHVSIRTSDTSSNAYASPSQAYGTLSYQCKDPKIITPRSFGIQFEPRYIFRAGRLDFKKRFGVGRALRALKFANNAKLVSTKRGDEWGE